MKSVTSEAGLPLARRLNSTSSLLSGPPLLEACLTHWGRAGGTPRPVPHTALSQAPLLLLGCFCGKTLPPTSTRASVAQCELADGVAPSSSVGCTLAVGHSASMGFVKTERSKMRARGGLCIQHCKITFTLRLFGIGARRDEKSYQLYD